MEEEIPTPLEILAEQLGADVLRLRQLRTRQQNGENGLEEKIKKLVRVRISEQSCQPFRSKVASDFGVKLPPNSV